MSVIKNLSDKLKRPASLALFGLCFVALPGCYERSLAPAVEYSKSDVETLSKEIENFDWE